jgi:cytochrome oxidase assembly protein ShyY1
VLRLRPRPKLAVIPTLAALALIALTISLGNWQSGRALEKDVIEARHAMTRDAAEVTVSQAPISAVGIDGRRVAASGEFLPAHSVYWDNQVVDHRPGLALITPLRLAGGNMVVLVDRGLVSATSDRAHLPRVAVPAGYLELHGRAYLPPARTLELQAQADQGAAPGGYAIWENLTPNKYARASGMQVQDFILRETGPAPAGLLRASDNGAAASPAVDLGGMTAARHRGYAFQWYALAALTAFLLLLFTFTTHDNAA